MTACRAASRTGPGRPSPAAPSKPFPGVAVLARTGEERLADEERAPVVILVQEPRRDAVGRVGGHLAACRVVDIHAPDLDLQLVRADAADLDVGLPEDREQLLAAAALSRSGTSTSAAMFAISESKVLRRPVVLDELLRRAVDGEACEQDGVIGREGQLAQDVLDLARADGPVERPEADRDAPRLAGLLELALGVDLATVGGRGERGEVELADRQAVGRHRCAEGRPVRRWSARGRPPHPDGGCRPPGRPREGGRGRRPRSSIVDAEGRDLLDRERSRDARLAFVDERLVVQRLRLRRLVLGDAAQRHVGHGLVAEAAIDAALGIGELVSTRTRRSSAVGVRVPTRRDSCRR